MREVVIREFGARNDCVGFCTKCPQSKAIPIGEGDKMVWYYRCDLPPAHTIRLRGKKV